MHPCSAFRSTSDSTAGADRVQEPEYVHEYVVQEGLHFKAPGTNQRRRSATAGGRAIHARRLPVRRDRQHVGQDLVGRSGEISGHRHA